MVNDIYDPWGVPIVFGDEGLAAINPCSYRGYYYDWETGYYYLQSRYYNPEMGRFLNADDVSLLNLDGDVLEGNLFIYCGNNKINRIDKNGFLGKHWYNKVSFVASVINAVLALVGLYKSRMAAKALKKFIRDNRNKLVREIYRGLFKYIKNLTQSIIGTVLSIASDFMDFSIGGVIAKALDYVDPWWGYKRNNGYIFN